MPPAVKDFIANFDPGNNDTTDWVSVVTFGTYANLNLANTQPLMGPVDTVMNTNFWSGGIVNYTNSIAGLTQGQTSDSVEGLIAEYDKSGSILYRRLAKYNPG